MRDSDAITSGGEKDIGRKKKEEYAEYAVGKKKTLQLREECTTRTELTGEDIMMGDGKGTEWMRLVYK